MLVALQPCELQLLPAESLLKLTCLISYTPVLCVITVLQDALRGWGWWVREEQRTGLVC